MYSATGEGDILSSSTTVHPCRRFSLQEIQFATEDFDDDLVIGQGGFGKVYKGQLSTEQPGHVVAIKRLDCMSDQGEHEFRAEIETLTKLRHCHLVSLIGYCDDNREMILVYEYMLNGTLYHHLHEAGTSLNWVQRMKIAIGAGRGLDYLHTGVGTTHGIIHRDVKSSNILLNENMTAMISDFGLSKIGQINQSSSWIDASVKGTFGYLDPEYFYTKKLSRKTDVYAFGVVLFELLTGRRAVDENREEEQCSLVRWAKKCVKERKLDQMVDSNIKGTISPKCLRRFTQIADRCVDSIPKERPTMTEVVASLQAILELQLKSDNSAKSSGKIGFIWKFPKYLNIVTKQNSGQSSTSSSTKWHGSFHDEWTHHQSVTKVLGGIKEFTYEELTHATGNFQETCLGNRIDGDVYKGWLDKLTYAPSNPSSGLPVEVERYHLGEGDYIQHMRLCGAYPHPNLYGPIGYCIEGEERFFVYESMHNGDFEDLLCSGVVATLPLIKKVKIAFGVARGILFYDKIPYPERLLERRDIMLDKCSTRSKITYSVFLQSPYT